MNRIFAISREDCHMAPTSMRAHALSPCSGYALSVECEQTLNDAVPFADGIVRRAITWYFDREYATSVVSQLRAAADELEALAPACEVAA